MVDKIHHYLEICFPPGCNARSTLLLPQCHLHQHTRASQWFLTMSIGTNLSTYSTNGIKSTRSLYICGIWLLSTGNKQLHLKAAPKRGKRSTELLQQGHCYALICPSTEIPF